MLDQHLEFHPEADTETFASIPAMPAVFLLRGKDPAGEPYVSKTANLRRRLQRLLSAPDKGPKGPKLSNADPSKTALGISAAGSHSPPAGGSFTPAKRLNLRDRVRWIEYTLTGSDFESGLLLYKVLRSVFPKTYSNRMRFRFAPLVKLHMENEYPRASITTRLGRFGGKNIYYGPFLSRIAAEKFLNDALDFFKMRRCVDDLNPDPAFPGCVYSEMKMCLAPCFKGCTDDEYRAEVVRVEDFLNTRGESLKRELAVERDAASSQLEFENAAASHARLEKLGPVLQQMPEVVHRIDRLHALIVQRSAIAEAVAIFRVDEGVIDGPILFPISSPEHTKSQSMEARIEEALASSSEIEVAGKNARSTQERMEHLAILKRWYYRGSRTGEIFFADDKGALPMRRIVRGIGRVYKGEAPEASVPMSPAENH